jgi:hypothetical protein
MGPQPAPGEVARVAGEVGRGMHCPCGMRRWSGFTRRSSRFWSLTSVTLLVVLLSFGPSYARAEHSEETCFGCGGGTDQHNIAVVLKVQDVTPNTANVSVIFARTVWGFEASDVALTNATILHFTEKVQGVEWMVQVLLLGDNVNVQVRRPKESCVFYEEANLSSPVNTRKLTDENWESNFRRFVVARGCCCKCKLITKIVSALSLPTLQDDPRFPRDVTIFS